MSKTYETVWASRKLAINQNGFTDIQGSAVLPIDCNYIEIFNDTGQDVILASDPGNSNSQITIHDGQMWTIGAPLAAPGSRARFPAGSPNPAGALQSATSGVSVTIVSVL